jgi:hypothetical protein
MGTSRWQRCAVQRDSCPCIFRLKHFFSITAACSPQLTPRVESSHIAANASFPVIATWVRSVAIRFAGKTIESS